MLLPILLRFKRQSLNDIIPDELFHQITQELCVLGYVKIPLMSVWYTWITDPGYGIHEVAYDTRCASVKQLLVPTGPPIGRFGDRKQVCKILPKRGSTVYVKLKILLSLPFLGDAIKKTFGPRGVATFESLILGAPVRKRTERAGESDPHGKSPPCRGMRRPRRHTNP